MTKDTFINSFGEKMTREIPNDPPNTTITLEEIQLLEDTLNTIRFGLLKKLKERTNKNGMEEKDKNRICDRCGKSCPSSRSLREHKNSHSPDYSCKKCGKAFTSTRNLKDHMNIVHERIKKYLCNLCGKSFGRSTNLGDHKTRKHKSSETSLGSSMSSVQAAS